MPSERIQRRFDGLLDEAEAAIEAIDWRRAQERAQAALSLDPDNADSVAFIEAAGRADGSSATPTSPPAAKRDAPLPDSFVSGRYQTDQTAARTVALQSGFNLVMWTGPDGALVTEAVAGLGDALEALFTWDAAAQQFQR